MRRGECNKCISLPINGLCIDRSRILPCVAADIYLLAIKRGVLWA